MGNDRENSQEAYGRIHVISQDFYIETPVYKQKTLPHRRDSTGCIKKEKNNIKIVLTNN